MNALQSRWIVLACCLNAQLLASPTTQPISSSLDILVVQQDPAKKDPPPKPANDVLDAEREKLRMKDVEAWKKLQVKSLDQVMDVKKTTQAIEMPASVTDAEKTKLAELLQKAKDGGGGARTGRSLREMEKMGYPALLFLVNHLREIDYKNPDEAMFGMQVNMTLQNITMGVNTGYVAIEVGEPMDPRKAQWNAMTVQQWMSGVSSWWSTREKFDEFIKNRKLKKEAELEGEGKDPNAKPPAPPEKKKV